MTVESILKNILTYAELIRCDTRFIRSLARCSNLIQLETTVNDSWNADRDVYNYTHYLISRHNCGKS